MPVTFQRELLGRFCPRHAGQRHQCQQRCQLLGMGCGSGDEDSDPISKWLDGVIHPETLEELPFDLFEMSSSIGLIAQQDPRLAGADLIVCSHPTILCILLASLSPRPVFTHASSTLLYGLPCHGCNKGGPHSTLRFYEGEDVRRYLMGVRRLLDDSPTGR